MRKILSIILTAAMLMSVLAAIPFSTSAEESQAKTVTNKSYEFSDFESAAEATYHSANKSVISIEKADDTQKKAAKFTSFVSLNNNNAWQSSLRISQTDSEGNVSSFKVKPGVTYDLTFKMKIDWANSAFKRIDSILVFYVGDYNGAYFNSSKALNDWSNKTNFYHGIDSGGCSDWTNKHFSFTVPSNLSYVDEVVIVPVIKNEEWAKSGVLWMDDIAIAENQTLETNVDFEDYDFFYNKSNNLGRGATIADTGDNAYGKALKFTKINQAGGNDWNGMWPQCAKISSVNKVGAFRVNHERKYEISFDIKKVTADVKFDLYAHFNAVNGNVDGIGYRDFTSQWSPKKVKIATFDSGASDWTHVTVELTVSPKATSGGNYSDLTFVPYINDGSWNKCENQEIYIDNVSVKALTKITTHNMAVDGQVVYAAANADISTVQASMPGAKVKNWYTDSSLTTLAEGKVGTADRELWAALETVTGDFENGNILAVDGFRENGYQLKQYAGTVNTTAITDYKEGGTPNNNASWPQILQLLNPDGTPFLTYTDHEYIVKFDMKVDNPSLVPDRATLALLHARSPYNNGELSATYPTIHDDVNSETKIQFKYSYKNSDGTYGTSGWYVNFTFNFTGLDNGLPVYVTPWQALTFTYFDNFQIIDVTAQKVISDAKGNEIARGYIGETAVMPQTDVAGDKNFVYYADPSDTSTPIAELMIKEDKSLTAVTSQIAVTDSAADLDKDTVSFKVRFDDVAYTSEGSNITLKKITVGNTRYDVKEIGMLVLPDEKLNGELTLDNYASLGAVKVSDSDLRFSAVDSDALEINAAIKTSAFDRDYTVVGYVKYGRDKVIYSKSRYGLNKNFNAAAGLEVIENGAYTYGSYRLVSNSEFNTDGTESVYDKWGDWGQSTTQGTFTKYSTDKAAYSENGNLVLHAEATSNTEMSISCLLSKNHFTTGYLEFRAKFADIDSLTGSIWLNSPGIPMSEMKYQANGTDTFVRPEMDILEFNSKNQSFTTLHSWGDVVNEAGESEYTQRDQIRLNNLIDGGSVYDIDLTAWHTYGLERTAEVIRIFIDGIKVYEYTIEQAMDDCVNGKKEGDYLYRTVNEVRALFENPVYLILSANANSLNAEETVDSYIDYVRFYK